ncbi:MAG: LysR family transcriptional regulator [Firmicutes bacterium]|nr:LysR family transcriptional regulator [Bacillota bacterium]
MADLGLYKVFYAVAKSGSLTKASKELYISQPAVSQAVKQLESQLGGRLFVRTPKGMKLTEDAGETMFGYIEQAMELIKAAENNFYRMKKLAVGTIHIGASDTLIKHHLLKGIDRYHEIYPQIRLQITNCTSMESLAYLKAGSVDIAFVNLPVPDDGLNVRVCAEVTDSFMTGRELAHLAKTVQPLAALNDHNLIMLEQRSNSRRMISDFAKSKGIELKPDIELGSLDLLADFAEKGLGVACLPREYALDKLELGDLVEIRTTPALPPRKIGLLTVRSVPLSFALKEFIALFPSIE